MIDFLLGVDCLISSTYTVMMRLDTYRTIWNSIFCVSHWEHTWSRGLRHLPSRQVLLYAC